MVTCSTFRSQITGRQHNIRSNITCKTKNLIYLISCKKCGLQCVGETENALHVRMNGHRSDIRMRKPEKPVAAHFYQPDHTMKDLEVRGIDKIHRNSKQWRKEREAIGSSPSECCLHSDWISYATVTYATTAYASDHWRRMPVTIDSSNFSLLVLYLSNRCEHLHLSVLYRVSSTVCLKKVLLTETLQYFDDVLCTQRLFQLFAREYPTQTVSSGTNLPVSSPVYFTHSILLFDVNVCSFVNKRLHCISMALYSCLVQGSQLMGRTNMNMVYSQLHLSLAYKP